MKKLYIRIQPIVFNYSGAMIDDDGNARELTSIPTQPFDLANYILDNNIQEVILYGNEKYGAGLQSILYRELGNITQYNVPIEIKLQEIDG